MHWDTLKWVYEAEHPKTVSKGTFAVLLALAYSMNPKNGRCNPSIERLCQLTRMGATSVKTAISTLKKAGILTLRSGKRMKRSNHYVIHYSTVPKKRRQASDVTLPTVSTISEPSDLNLSSNSDPNKVQNPPTNQLQVNTHGTPPSLVPKSTSLQGSDSDSDLDGDGVGAGERESESDKAAEVALQWAQHDEWLRQVKGKWVKYDEESIKSTYLYEALAYLPRPTIEDARRINRMVEKAIKDGIEDAWVWVGEVVEAIKSYENDHPGEIEYPRAYFYKCLKNEFVNIVNQNDDDDNYTEDDGAYERAGGTS